MRLLRIESESIILIDGAYKLPYAALSHCWGSGKDITRTSRQSLAYYTTVGISISNLPKTFQDAIHICRRLDIHYVWIDSLCIIQDDAQDWQQQASCMADVYSNAYVTIAASHAKDPTQGCYSSADPSYVGYRVPGYPNIVVRRESELPSLFESGTLFTRGWIYQEMVLSPRVIHFCANEVVWQCAAYDHRRQSMTTVIRSPISIVVGPKTFTETGYERQWRRAIEAYSWRALTFHEDKLPAIAALAMKQCILRPTDQYLAGIWKDTLLHDLLWHSKISHAVTANEPSKRSSASTGVPSWSWASMTGGAGWFPDCSSTPYKNVQVLDTKYATDGPVTSGTIKQASITIRAPLITLITTYSSETWMNMVGGNLAVRNVRFTAHPPGLDVYAYHYDEFSVPDVLIPNILYAIPLAIQTPIASITEWFNLETLPMLLVAKTESEGVYTRVGVVQIQSQEAAALARSITSNPTAVESARTTRSDATFYEFEWPSVWPSTWTTEWTSVHDRFVETIEAMETHVITLI